MQTLSPCSPIGAGFDTNDITFGNTGGMSFAFPDCKSAGSGGGVV